MAAVMMAEGQFASATTIYPSHLLDGIIVDLRLIHRFLGPSSVSSKRHLTNESNIQTYTHKEEQDSGCHVPFVFFNYFTAVMQIN